MTNLKMTLSPTAVILSLNSFLTLAASPLEENIPLFPPKYLEAAAQRDAAMIIRTSITMGNTNGNWMLICSTPLLKPYFVELNKALNKKNR